MNELRRDKYGVYVDDDGVQELPENPTLIDRIGNLLRMDDKWGWRETINITGYDAFELLREAHDALMNGCVYPPGEVQTKGRIQDEPWYSQFQSVQETIAFGYNQVPFEFCVDGYAKAMMACKEKAHLDGVSDERLELWVRYTMYNFQSNIEYLKIQKDHARLALLRPDTYDELEPDVQWQIDKRLGILDWNGNESSD